MFDLLSAGQQELLVSKGARWFIKTDDETELARGFTSKENASTWIKSLGREVDWRAGYTFRLRGGDADIQIVNRSGKLAKP